MQGNETTRIFLLTFLLIAAGACSSSGDGPSTRVEGKDSAREAASSQAVTDGSVENARGSGSVGGWRSRPGQRTVFNRGFRIPTTLVFRADRGNWRGEVSVVETPSNRSLCQRSISGGSQTSCFGIQGNFRITVANNADSRDTATGEIRFNN